MALLRLLVLLIRVSTADVLVVLGLVAVLCLLAVAGSLVVPRLSPVLGLLGVSATGSSLLASPITLRLAPRRLAELPFAGLVRAVARPRSVPLLVARTEARVAQAALPGVVSEFVFRLSGASVTTFVAAVALSVPLRAVRIPAVAVPVLFVVRPSGVAIRCHGLFGPLSRLSEESGSCGNGTK